MKTIVDTSNTSGNRYIGLFNMATKALQDAKKLSKDLEISSIEQYFHCLGDLMELPGGEKYAFLLPLDEPFFEIDVNTREIKVPKEFSKGVGVQTDVISETLMFKVNRFVDAMDLNEVDHIYVQWQYGPDDQPTAKGISEVQFRYINYHPDYLLFAWPITNKVTKNYGNLKFSVRFMSDDNGQVIYSLNTKSATVIINKALNAASRLDYDPNEYDDNALENLFKKAISNSVGTSDSDVEVAIPSFNPANHGTPLGNTAYLKDDQIMKYAIATAPGAGTIGYKWEVPDINQADVEAYRYGSDYKRTEDATPKGNKKYYSKKKDAEAYNLITFADGDNSKFPTLGDDTDKVIYELKAFLEIPQSQGDKNRIVGVYTLNAENRVGWNSGTTRNTNEQQVLRIPGPEKLVFTANGDLVSDGTFVADDALTLSTDVDFDIVPTGVDLPIVTFTWQKTLTEPAVAQFDPADPSFDEAIADDGWVDVGVVKINAPEVADEFKGKYGNYKCEMAWTADSLATYLADQDNLPEKMARLPGWYRAKITNVVNREPKVLYTTHCRVTNPSVAPDLSHKAGTSAIGFDIAVGEEVELPLMIKNRNLYESKLESDSLTYQWYTTDGTPLVGKDSTGRPYAGEVPAETDESGNANISVKVPHSNGVAAYYCIVTNVVNTDTETSESGHYTVS